MKNDIKVGDLVRVVDNKAQMLTGGMKKDVGKVFEVESDNGFPLI